MNERGREKEGGEEEGNEEVQWCMNLLVQIEIDHCVWFGCRDELTAC